MAEHHLDNIGTALLLVRKLNWHGTTMEEVDVDDNNSTLLLSLCPDCEFVLVQEPVQPLASLVTGHLVPGVFFIILSIRWVNL